MRFDYTLTIDDLRDALKPTQPDGRPAPSRGRAFRGLLGWVVFIALALLILYMLKMSGPPAGVAAARSGATPPPPAQNLWVTLVPNLIPAGIAALILVVSHVQQRVRFRRLRAALAAGRPAPLPSKPSSWVGFLLISPIALLLLANMPSAAIPWDPSPSTAMWTGFAPWIAVLIVIGLLGARATRSSAERQWLATPALRRNLTADVSDAGVWTTDGVCDTLYRWPMITRYRETEALLVLTLEDARTLLLPKRAAPDENALRGLVQSHVATGTFLPRDGAFPVRPLPVVEVAE